MATLAIRNLPDDIVQRIKTVASTKSHSMEQEVRELLEIRYASRKTVVNEFACVGKRCQKPPRTRLLNGKQ